MTPFFFKKKEKRGSRKKHDYILVVVLLKIKTKKKMKKVIHTIDKAQKNYIIFKGDKYIRVFTHKQARLLTRQYSDLVKKLFHTLTEDLTLKK